MRDYEEFELKARSALEEHLNVKLPEGKISINGKLKSFDLLDKDKKIVGDVKKYTTTKGGNRPSAKFSTLNEYCWLMQLVEKYDSNKWRKLFVVGEDKDMLLQYVREHEAWLDDIEFYYFSYTKGIERVR